jgi:DNA-binding NarL/FixJ family response regulator
LFGDLFDRICELDCLRERGMTKQQLLATTLERETERIPVWLVDDNRHYSTAVSSVLNESSEVECTRTFPRCEAALEALEGGEVPPSVILLDIQLPGMGGLEAIRPFKSLSPATGILMITVFNDEAYVRTALREGASGYLLKKSSAQEFIRAIQTVVGGGMPVDPFVLPKMMKFMKAAALEREQDANGGLTEKEKRILRYITKGMNDQEIALKMELSYNTILYHTKNIHDKLGVHSRRELIVKAIKEHLF